MGFRRERVRERKRDTDQEASFGLLRGLSPLPHWLSVRVCRQATAKRKYMLPLAWKDFFLFNQLKGRY